LRRIGVLNLLGETDSESQAWDALLRKRLGELGWIEGSTVRITHFWGDGTADHGTAAGSVADAAIDLARSEDAIASALRSFDYCRVRF
jgi:hypothetical protein